MNNRIVIEPAFKIREIARNALAGYWPRMYLGIFIYFVILSGMMTILDLFFSTIVNVLLPTGEYLPVSVGYASWLYQLAVGGPLQYGLALFLLSFLRRREIDNGHLMDGFSHFGKTFILYLLYCLRIFLWSLLFVIPGIIAVFRYSQAFYLQVDHPDWTASQCLRESKYLMMGNKGKLFYLNLTFIGWYILANLPSLLVDGLINSVVVFIVLWLLTALPLIVVDLYAAVSRTVFYELLTGRLVVSDGYDNDYRNM